MTESEKIQDAANMAIVLATLSQQDARPMFLVSLTPAGLVVVPCQPVADEDHDRIEKLIRNTMRKMVKQWDAAEAAEKN